MTKFIELEKYKEPLYLCGECRCGFCRELCPVFTQLRQEALHTRGRFAIAQALLDGAIDVTDRVVDIATLCTTCNWCRERCPNNTFVGQVNIDVGDIVEAFRHDLWSLGQEVPAYKRIAENVRRVENPYGEPREARTASYEPVKVPEKADLLYFVGCTSSYRTPEIARNTIDILNATGADYTILGQDEGCCGSTLLRTGQTGEAKKLAKHEAKLFEDKGVKSVITSCAGCYRTLKVDYPELVPGFDIEVKHTIEYLYEMMKDGKIKFKSIPKMTVTYHDPCHIGRGTLQNRYPNVYEVPREILNEIPGIKLVEMPYNRDLAICCGGGGGLMATHADLANSIAAERIGQAKEKGAEVLVTACPFCVLNFRRGMDKVIDKVDVVDITEIILKAL